MTTREGRSTLGAGVRHFAEPVSARARLVTWLTPRERHRVAAAAGERVVLYHRSSIAGVQEDLATAGVDAALTSAALVRPDSAAHLAMLVRGFPAVTFICLVMDTIEAQALLGTLLMGRAGVRAVIDGRVPEGWAMLRRLLVQQELPTPFHRLAFDRIAAGLREIPDNPEPRSDGQCAEGCLLFFRTVFSSDVHNARQLAARIGVVPSTMVSRFYRAGLPSPKRYIDHARLAWAAQLAESSGMSIADIANRLHASSPQAFGRSVRRLTGFTASQFRYRFTGEAMLNRFREALIVPYRDTLRSFDPRPSLAARGGTSLLSDRNVDADGDEALDRAA